jgi:hypothetical protein
LLFVGDFRAIILFYLNAVKWVRGNKLRRLIIDQDHFGGTDTAVIAVSGIVRLD